MNKKHVLLTICSFVCFLGIANLAYTQRDSTQKPKLTVNASKNIYKLGEVIGISFELKNESNDSITFQDIFGVGTGFLHVEASRNGKDFTGCDDPDWGLLDIAGAKTIIGPNETAVTSSTILWDWRKQDVPVFRFADSGVYYLRARYSLTIEGEKDSIQLESEPIRITIEKPNTDDSEVWNKIKDNGHFAYFIQKGDIRIPSYKTEERAKFEQEIEQILVDHPNSFYAFSLRQSLEKFRIGEARRLETLIKLQKPMP